MKTVNDVVNQFGATTYHVWDAGVGVGTYSPDETVDLMNDWGLQPVIEVGCMNGVHIHLFDVENLTVGQCRNYLGLTQENVHQMIGVPIRTLQNWESGSRECPEYVRKLVVAELFRQCEKL